MPNIKSAIKKTKQDVGRTVRNNSYRSKVAGVLRSANTGVTKKKEAFLESAYSSIDKAAKKNVIHKNKAARLKGRVSRLIAKKA